MSGVALAILLGLGALAAALLWAEGNEELAYLRLEWQAREARRKISHDQSGEG